MLILRRRAHARAGLVGNPSDGYGGKTLSIIVRNFSAEIILYEWEDVELVWTDQDQSRFRSVHELVRDVKLHGYYGGMRLVKATVKKFVEYCVRHGHALHERNFSIRYHSDIPRQVGLAGSSAIIVATLRCLCDFYGVTMPREVQPSLALSVEVGSLASPPGCKIALSKSSRAWFTWTLAQKRCTISVAILVEPMSRSIQRYCRPYTSPTAPRRASQRRCSIMTSAVVSTAVNLP